MFYYLLFIYLWLLQGGAHMPQYACGNNRTLHWNHFSPFTLGVLGASALMGEPFY